MPTTVSFLFWNIHKAEGSRFHESLRRLAHAGIDVLIFAEPPAADHALLTAVNGGPAGTYDRVPSDSRRLMLFTRRPRSEWSSLRSGQVSSRITAHRLSLTGALDIILIGAHLRSPFHADLRDRAEWARKLAPEIVQIESDVGHSRTVLVGDLNMNPFDPGMVDATALHAVMSRALIAPIRKLSARRDHPVFSNPMWSLLGDRSPTAAGSEPRAPGSYFYGTTEALANHFWQMFDRLLLRPRIDEHADRSGDSHLGRGVLTGDQVGSPPPLGRVRPLAPAIRVVPALMELAMPDTIRDLWGDGIQVDDVSPIIILNTQAAILQKRTKGIIVAEVIKDKFESSRNSASTSWGKSIVIEAGCWNAGT